MDSWNTLPPKRIWTTKFRSSKYRLAKIKDKFAVLRWNMFTWKDQTRQDKNHMSDSVDWITIVWYCVLACLEPHLQHTPAPSVLKFSVCHFSVWLPSLLHFGPPATLLLYCFSSVVSLPSFSHPIHAPVSTPFSFAVSVSWKIFSIAHYLLMYYR